MSMLYQRLQRLGNPLDWCPVDKGILSIAIIVPLYVAIELWRRFVLAHAEFHAFVHVDYLQRQAPVFMGLIAASLLVVLLGLLLRRNDRAQVLYPPLTCNFYGLSLVYFGYMAGTMTPAAGLVLAGAPLVGFILFDRGLIYFSMALSLASLLLLSHLAAAGVIPYAPAFRSNITVAGDGARFWLYCMYFFCAPLLISIVLLGDVVMTRWRRREAEVRMLSLTDVLTGVHNRRSIMDYLEREVARHRRSGKPLAVVMADLDHFKKVNDTWGHVSGDRVLRMAAQVLMETLRETDAVGRYGGEEFMLVLPDTDAAGATILAERCRQKIEGSVVATDSGGALRITGSFGVYCNRHGAAADADDLVRLADDALYRAKDGGRNRVEVARDPAREGQVPLALE